MEISISDPIYPEQLKKLKQPPQVLYVEGNMELLKMNRNINNRNEKTNTIRRKNGKRIYKRIKPIWIKNCKRNG